MTSPDTNNTNTLDDIAQGIKNVILERFSSPFLLSFAIAWLLINLQFVVIVLSDANIHYKLKLIVWYFKDSSSSLWHISHIWAGPLIYALGYTFGYPYFSRVVQKFITQRKIIEMQDRQEAEKNEVFTRKYIDRIYLRHGNEVTRYKADILKLQDTEAQLLAQLESLKTPQVIADESKSDVMDYEVDDDLQIRMSKEYPNTNGQKIEDLSSAERNVIQYMIDHENRGSSTYIEESTIVRNLTKQAPIETRHGLAQLVAKRIIVHSGSIYSLTPKTRAEVIDNGGIIA